MGQRLTDEAKESRARLFEEAAQAIDVYCPEDPQEAAQKPFVIKTLNALALKWTAAQSEVAGEAS